MVMLMTAGQLFFKLGASQIAKNPSAFLSLAGYIWSLVGNIYVWFTLVLYGIAFGLWLFILSKFELSTALPLMSGAVILAVLFHSYSFFGE